MNCELDLERLSKIILEGIFENELDNQLRKEILGNVPDEHYDWVCQVFHETRHAYFRLGLEVANLI
jgi:hypothetical protein